MKYSLVAVAAVVVAALAGAAANAQNAAKSNHVRIGREFAIANCSECHVVVPRRWTPARPSGPPDFDQIADMPGVTRIALLAFLRSPHPTMPNLILSDRKAGNVIDYILSLKRPEKIGKGGGRHAGLPGSAFRYPPAAPLGAHSTAL
jgi:mono/diheme cytochrome c family protein